MSENGSKGILTRLAESVSIPQLAIIVGVLLSFYVQQRLHEAHTLDFEARAVRDITELRADVEPLKLDTVHILTRLEHLQESIERIEKKLD